MKMGAGIATGPHDAIAFQPVSGTSSVWHDALDRQIVRLTSCSLRKSDVLIRLRQAAFGSTARGSPEGQAVPAFADVGSCLDGRACIHPRCLAILFPGEA
ncbi:MULTISPECIES: hypothetical protein [unclassified Sphingobium]|uniref:hypothetical protein n=1 Tax=unclassified Sphingobium TaxID=2611147 RepID=UPI0022255B1C|nr:MULTISPECIES: hypothetical protein [unclassified Sphingobium]MCW2396064.1 hypothetical protein [Sphingobium sp. B8D3B]MCW2419580.1 hypothetical protein [Sphingobium sp. B8D3C]